MSLALLVGEVVYIVFGQNISTKLGWKQYNNLWLKTMLMSCDSHVWFAYNGVGVLPLHDAKTSVISWITLSLIIQRMEGSFQKRCI